MGYGKMSLWQKIAIYVVVGGIIYAAIYFLFLKGGTAGGYSLPSY